MPPTPASMLRTKRSWPGTSTKPMRIASPAGADQVEVGEAEIDGDAAPLLLGQPVGIDAGKGAYQRTLAMVDMARGPNDDSLHIEQFTAAFVELCWARGGMALGSGVCENSSSN